MWDRLAERMEGKLVVLEPLTADDVGALRLAADDERIWTWMWTRDVEAWIDRTLHDEHLQPFAVLRDGAVVGSTS